MKNLLFLDTETTGIEDARLIDLAVVPFVRPTE